MATQADVRRIALSLPATEEEPGHFAFAVRNKGKLKGFVWVWLERLAPKKPRVPQPKVLAARVANLVDKDLMLTLDPKKFFTEQHYDGFPAILVRLPAVTARELRPIITEAWRCQAPKDLDTLDQEERPPRRRRVAPTATLALFACVFTAAAGAQAPAINWGPAPPFFPAGARFAVLQGDPSQPGIFTVRLELPAGYIIRPHFHTPDEPVTVVSGALILGTGDSVRTQGADALPAGAFATAKAREHHYAVARGKTVVPIHGQGPFDITYVNPKDDPRNAAPRP